VKNQRKNKGPTSKQIATRKRLHVRIQTKAGTLGASLDAQQLADICHVSKSHAYRWIKGDIVPKGYMELIQIKALGLIPSLEWDGWRVKDGTLFSPRDFEFTPEEIDQVQIIRDLNRFNTKRIDLLESQLENTRRVAAKATARVEDIRSEVINDLQVGMINDLAKRSGKVVNLPIQRD